MRIATWNVERLKHKNKLEEMLAECRRINADILVFTETDSRIKPDYSNVFSTRSLRGETTPVSYTDTEIRVSIYTNYRCICQYPTYDDKTAICLELETENGNLVVYGTIIGISGNRRKDYVEDLGRQLEDIERLVRTGHNVCVIGDYNCSFGDNFYYTKQSRESMLQCFGANHISILTAEKPECIDHIAVSDSFMKGMTIKSIEEWNLDTSLSDHKGIAVDIICC